MRRSFFFVLLAGALPVAALAGERPPNVLLIVADDLGYAELGCQGCKDVPTPHIDSLAKNGIRFTQGYVTAPFCSPSRAGLLTGRYPMRFGYEHNVIGKRNLDERIGLPATEKTLAEVLHQAGHKTGVIGKWHLGGSEAFHPLKRGFDTFYGFLHEGHSYAPPYYPALISHLRQKEPPYDDANPILRGREPVEEPEYFTEALTREAVAFLEANRDRPFFLYLAYNAVHSPMQAAPKYFDRFRNVADPHRRTFAAMLAALDDSVGAVLTKLEQLRLERDTLIFFLSDNGGPTAELTSSNLPLRGGKGQLWEGGIRVPFLVQWKGKLPAGHVYPEPVSAVDIFPTAIAAARGALPEGVRLDGVNLIPFLDGTAKGRPHEELFWRRGANVALRHGAWKLIRQAEPETKPALRLYDLSRDEAETMDRASQEPQVFLRLQKRLEAVNAEMAPPLWGPQ